MLKLFTELVEFTEVEKNGVLPEPSSFLALTSILTPLAGMADVIVTAKLNGSIEGSRNEPLEGLVCTARLASEELGFFLHPVKSNKLNRKLTINRDLAILFDVVDFFCKIFILLMPSKHAN